MSTRIKNMREVLILAGISEINANGITDFSVRRVAAACNVSCAAPYKHFKGKSDFIAAIIDYVNEQWREQQREILATCGDDLRKQIVEICCGYLRFLMEKPYFRSILMLKNEEFDNIYHRPRDGQISRTELVVQQIYEANMFTPEAYYRKVHIIRSMLFGTMFMIHTGELEYNEKTMENLRYSIDREFDLP